MPTFTDVDNGYSRTRPIPYASEEELLAFANKVRAAGEAEPLEALFPSEPNDGKACLIANAVNFKSSVLPSHHWNENGEHTSWQMHLPKNTAQKRVRAIAEAIDCEYDVQKKTITLPRLIGNTAHAFDSASRGWITKYRKHPIER